MVILQSILVEVSANKHKKAYNTRLFVKVETSKCDDYEQND